MYAEVVVSGAGLTGSAEIAASKWIDVKPISDVAALSMTQQKFGLGVGELSTILLGKEVNADLVLIDEIKARKAAQEHGLVVLGCVGVLENAFRSQFLPDLREAYRQLLAAGAYVDPRILDKSLKTLRLRPL